MRGFVSREIPISHQIAKLVENAQYNEENTPRQANSETNGSWASKETTAAVGDLIYIYILMIIEPERDHLLSPEFSLSL